MKIEEDAYDIVYAILNDMNGRTGFRGLWQAIDGDVQVSIVEKWIELTREVLEEEDSEPYIVCGDEMTHTADGKIYECKLPYGHPGWHDAEDQENTMQWVWERDG